MIQPWRSSALLLAVITIASAAVVNSPSLRAITLGTETESYRWDGGAPSVEGRYDAATSAYTLTGNGQGIYWCQDGAGFAYVDQQLLCGEFTFTARIKDVQLPASGVSQIGIAVKGRIGTSEPVLSLRWDTYWAGAKGSGLTWFNRMAKMSDMPSMDVAPAEKSCHGTGQGCLGMGLENSLAGYPNQTDLWLRVKRVVSAGESKYYLYARPSSSAEWTEIQSVAGTNNACGASAPLKFVPNMKLPNFMIPEDEHGRVYVGLFVANGTFGKEKVTATFDNISLETQNADTRLTLLDNSFSPTATWWPSFLGPNGNYTGNDDKWELVPDLRDAIQVWKSEAATPPGKRDSQLAFGVCESGGGSSPVAADGKVYLYHFLPQSDTRDVVLCVNAINGKTMWRTVLDPSTYICGKNTLSNHTACVYGGRVFACGSSGTLYCLDTAKGNVLWKKSAGGLPFTSGLVTAGGVLVYNTGGGRNSESSTDVHGVDIVTGSEKWKCADCSGGGATPSVWKNGGKEYVVVANREGVIRCIDPSNGTVLWQKGGYGCNQFTIRVSENYALVNGFGTTQKSTEGEIVGLRITPKGATELWRLPKLYGSFQSAVIYKDYAYGYPTNPDSEGSSLLVVEMATGKITAKQTPGKTFWGGTIVATAGKGDGWLFAVNNRVVVNQLEGHEPFQAIMFNSLPEFRLSSLAYWNPPNRQTCTYSENNIGMAFPYVDGRLFIRGWDAIYCYDLRRQQACAGTRVVREAARAASRRGLTQADLFYDLQGRVIAIRESPSRQKIHTSGIAITSRGPGRTARVHLFR